MLYLWLSVLCSVLIANFLMVFGRKKGINTMPIFLGNYFIATVFSAFSLNPAPSSGFDVSFGMLTGAFFLINLWVYQKCIVVNGLSLSVGAMRIAMILPIVISLIFFGETLGVVNILGIALGLMAFGLKAEPGAMRNFLWIMLLFVISGFSDASMKIFKELGSGNESFFVFMVFCSAFVYTLGSIILGKIAFSPKLVLYGFILGIPNRYSTVFFLKGLDQVPAAIAYPIVAVSIVLLSIFSDIFLWKRRPGGKDLLLWILLIISLILLNL
ncbi:MAG: EamA family transporter [Candidatus Cloacimonetes bacterium]|nr:EamA family transporter [Candidatus Cloacimonadota bacterium]